MIDYSPFWKTLEKRNENWYTMITDHGLSSATLYRLKHNENVSTKTLNDLCAILNCGISDIVQYIPSENDHIYDKKKPANAKTGSEGLEKYTKPIP